MTTFVRLRHICTVNMLFVPGVSISVDTLNILNSAVVPVIIIVIFLEMFCQSDCFLGYFNCGLFLLPHKLFSFLLISVKEGKEADKKHFVVWN